MPDLLDLEVTFTAPPAAAPAGTLASIALRCAELGLSHGGDLLADPLTEAAREELQWYLESYWQWPFAAFKARAARIEAMLPEIGERLYESLFQSRQAINILNQWEADPTRDRQISLISDRPAVLSLPWSLLHDEQGYLAMRAQHPVSIIRRLPQSQGARARVFEPPLRVLLVTARPTGTGFVDPRTIARELLEELEPQVAAGAVEVEFLRPPTLPALRERLRDAARPVHVLHFDGHGTFQQEATPPQLDETGVRLRGGGRGLLAFEDERGELDLVEAETLANVLHGSGVPLAVLTACQSALGSAEDAFSSVAARLIRGGVDAVVAMSASVLVVTATRYAERFYRELARGSAVPTAHERARQALHDDPRRHLLRRHQDTEAQPIELRDWWLPHFYQQRALSLRPAAPHGASGQEASPIANPTSDIANRLGGTMPEPPRYEFSGRARELWAIERALWQGRVVVLHGFGGVGKTALAREAADWLTRSGLYARAFFHSFETGSDATALLSALGTFLGVYDAAFNPNQPAEAVARLRGALAAQPTLIVADNLETILPTGESPLPGEARAQLWETLLALAGGARGAGAAGLLLTTRDVAFGDGRLAPGARVLQQRVAGLAPDDAYALASRLLDALAIDRARAPYAALRDLLVQLDHHPLAIQLVLPALHDHALEEIRSRFDALLDRFVDDSEQGRSRSLLASLEYSLRRLSDEQRRLLPRLALFEGGALESQILAITEIPEREWATLRPALEQAALLLPERVHEAIALPFLRFHPVLAPYLRTQPGADDPALRQRYAARYHALASYLYQEDNRNPLPVRALVRRELPNLRRALDLLLAQGEQAAAVEMADRIAKFLDYFGLQRERDELWRKTTAQAGQDFRADYLRESDLGEAELAAWRPARRPRPASHSLLQRHEALPAGTPLGVGSYEHCTDAPSARALPSRGGAAGRGGGTAARGALHHRGAPRGGAGAAGLRSPARGAADRPGRCARGAGKVQGGKGGV